MADLLNASFLRKIWRCIIFITVSVDLLSFSYQCVASSCSVSSTLIAIFFLIQVVKISKKSNILDGVDLWMTSDNFDFLEQICPKKVFLIENRKSEHPHWILHIAISWGTKFHFKQFRILEPHLPKTVVLVKNGKSEYDHWILHFQISLVTKLRIFPKRIFPVENRKS